jgi:heterodisulfide reductase subunit C
MADSNGNHDFLQKVIALTPGGQTLMECLQCGTCGGSCPSGPDMDATPRKLIAMLRAGMEEEVLSSNTAWYCVSCYYCTVRCPQQIPITDLMYTIKHLTIESGKYHREKHVDFSESFIGFVDRYGRSFELGLATRYHLMHHPFQIVSKGGLGFQLMQKGRLRPIPDRIHNMPQLTAILAEARRIESQEHM